LKEKYDLKKIST